MPMSMLSLLVLLAAPPTTALSSPAPDSAPDADRVLADVCVGATGDEAKRRFTQRALRLRRAATSHSYGLIKQPSPKFEAWTPGAERLERDEALHLVGEHDLADRHAMGSTLETWGGVLSVLGSLGAMGVGFAGGASLALFVFDPALGQIGTAAALGLIGMGAGAIVGLAALPVIHFFTTAMAVDDDEALVAIQRYNKRAAEEAGLGEAEIPFEYLGY